VSRREWIRRHRGEDRLERYYVDPGPLEWLVDMLYDVGAVRLVSVGMSATHSAVSWEQIYYWVEAAGMQDLPVFWRRKIVELSEVVAESLNKYSEEGAQVPYQPDD
jgi:hypothetical protein